MYKGGSDEKCQDIPIGFEYAKFREYVVHAKQDRAEVLNSNTPTLLPVASY